jgi:hypothetical protein
LYIEDARIMCVPFFIYINLKVCSLKRNDKF